MAHCYSSVLVAIAFTVPLAWAGESATQPVTAGQLVIDMIAEVPAANAGVCTSKKPEMKADFDLALVKFRERVEAITGRLLSLPRFEALNHEPAPQEVVDRQQVRREARAEKLKNADVSKDCPVFLRNTLNPDEASLEAAISDALGAVQGVIEIKKKMATQ